MLHIWVVAAAAEENIFMTIRARCCVMERVQRGRETQPVFFSYLQLGTVILQAEREVIMFWVCFCLFL